MCKKERKKILLHLKYQTVSKSFIQGGRQVREVPVEVHLELKVTFSLFSF